MSIFREISVGRAQDLDVQVNARGKWFVDEFGRTLLLRGINLCGNSKLPTSPPGSTHLSHGFYEKHRDVSFVGRPFGLDDAAEHFERIRAWGLTFARLLVPWESLEHKGPGLYDEEFIDHLKAILDIAHSFNIKCFIDPHQDTWSRYSGGSGAPAWTFEVAGLDMRKFTVTGAAHLHQMTSEQDTRLHLWPTNHSKLACATMFTLFFGGDTFAPNAKYKGQSIQRFLQDHFVNCFKHLAVRLKGHPAVVGFEVINEPHGGYIGLQSLEWFDQTTFLHLGSMPNALQSFALGDGIPQSVPYYSKSWPWPSRKTGKKLLNKDGVSVWLPGHSCIWRKHGVWDMKDGTPVILKPNYFTIHPETGKPIDFNRDFYIEFIEKYMDGIHQVDPDLLVFFEPIPNEEPPMVDERRADNRLIYAPHWYDLNALFNKTFSSMVTHDVQQLSRGALNIINATYVGITGARKNYKNQVRNIVAKGELKLGKRPCIIGECGIPMDINEKRAYQTGDFECHNQFLDVVIHAMEENLVGFTLWNYNPHNDNKYGDHWNGEDFSIYSTSDHSHRKESAASTEASYVRQSIAASETSEDDMASSPFDICDSMFVEGEKSHVTHAGGRVLDAVIRPYACKVAGIPITSRFDRIKLEYSLEMASSHLPNTKIDKENYKRFLTEIYIPNYHFGDVSCPLISVSDGEWRYDKAKQTLFWIHDPSFTQPGVVNAVNRYVTHVIGQGQVKHWITIRHPSPPAPSKKKLFERLFDLISDHFDVNYG